MSQTRLLRTFPFLLILFAALAAFHITPLQAQTAPLHGRTPQASSQTISGIYTLPTNKLQMAIEYTHKRTLLEFAESGWSILQLLLLLAFGIVARMRDRAVRFSRRSWVQGLAFSFDLFLATTLLSLPLDMAGHYLAVEYGQSVQPWASWFGDQAKSFLLSYLVGGLIVLLLFWVIRKSPRRWWFWFWFPAMASVIFGIFVTPIFVDPLFNRFEPLSNSNPALVSRLKQVVARGGISIPPDRMFLMKASEKVTGLNAYVTGIGSSKRVVVWDTTIAKAAPDDISFIFGHEMGHYVLNHIYKAIAFAGIVMLAGFWIGYHCVQWLLRRFGVQWRISGQQDWAALGVVLLVMLTLAFLSEPVTNAFSRWEEHQADVFGQEAIHGIVADPQATATRSFQELGEESLTDPTPHPLIEFWTFSHPSIADRKAFAAAYNPWVDSATNPGSGPQFFKR